MIIPLERARQVLRYFHTAATAYPDTYPFASVDELIERIDRIMPKWVDRFGMDLQLATKLPETTIKKNIEAIAHKNQGTPPSQFIHLNDFYEALLAGFDTSKLSNWVRVASTGVKQAAVEIKEGAEKVAIFGGISLAIVAAVAGAVFFFVYLKGPARA